MEEFIDSRNSEIWELLSKNYKFKIENSQNEEYSCFTKNSEAIIYVVPNKISKDSFTHELLHIYLKYKEFYLGSSIKNFIRGDETLQFLLSENLLEHIGNCLDHLKMFEIYIDLGFEKKEFLYDFELFKCSKDELNRITKHFEYFGNVNPNAIDFYIGKLIAILCDPNEENDYTKELLEFKELDFELYEIVNNLVAETKKFDIEKNDFLNSYRDISSTFYHNLKNWTIIKLN